MRQLAPQAASSCSAGSLRADISHRSATASKRRRDSVSAAQHVLLDRLGHGLGVGAVAVEDRGDGMVTLRSARAGGSAFGRPGRKCSGVDEVWRPGSVRRDRVQRSQRRSPRRGAGVALGPQVDDQFAATTARRRGCATARRALVADQVQHRQIRRRSSGVSVIFRCAISMPSALERVRQIRGRDVAHERVAVERPRRPAVTVQLTQPSSASPSRVGRRSRCPVGVAVARLVARQDVDPGVHALAGPRRHLDDPRLRDTRASAPSRRAATRAGSIASILLIRMMSGFLELLAVDVEDLRAERPARLEAEGAQRAHRVDEHAERGDGVGVAVHPAQRIADRGAQVGAAADRLGDEHVRAACRRSAARRRRRAS